jgi:two-component system, LuxR family, response regulator FixJ
MSSDTVVVHVIDDDDSVRESLEFLLRTARLLVRTYDSAAAFLEALPQIQVGCVITDVRMPELSGIDLLKLLKELDRDVPVIVMTGHGDVPMAVEAMKFGAADFLKSLSMMLRWWQPCARHWAGIRMTASGKPSCRKSITG